MPSQASPHDTPSLKFPEKDFGDFLPPMLVKELRQGLRAHTFVFLILTLHGLLATLLAIAVLSSNGDSFGSLISRIILGFLAISIIIVQPLRAISSIHSEIRSNTIEMINLTRLSPWRITLGKWLALSLQSLLLTVSLLPYLILRYFLGGMDLFAELHLLTWIFIASTCLITLPLGLSAFPNVIIRVIIPLIAIGGIGTLIIAWTGNQFLFDNLLRLMSLELRQAPVILGIYLFIILYSAWNALNLVTREIAPPAVNLTTLHRLVTLVLAIAIPCAFIPATSLDFGRGITILMTNLFIVTPAISIALTETFFPIPHATQGFKRLGPLQPLARAFLSPGWPSAIAFTLLLASISAIFLYFGVQIYLDSYHALFGAMPYASSIDTKHVLNFTSITLSCYNTSALCLLITFMIRRRLAPSLGLMILVSILLAIFTIVTAILSGVTNESNLLWLGFWNPVSITSIMSSGDNEYEAILTAAILQSIIYFGTLIGLSAYAKQQHRQQELIQSTLSSPSS